MTSTRPTEPGVPPHRGGGRPIAARITDMRSVWGPPVDVPLGERVTVLVGPNRAGTSNVAWALAAALDPRVAFEPVRDRPRRRRVVEPTVVVDRADGTRSTTRWDADTGRRSVEGPSSGREVVLSRVHESSPRLLRHVAVDLDDREERRRLAATIRATFRHVLPQVTAVEVDPGGRVRVVDDLGSRLPAPEIRALVALGAARHLAALGRAPQATIIEAPEAFLHPAAQEAVGELLVTISEESGHPVVVTTTSPFAIPRREGCMVVSLARDAIGRTDVVGTAAGDQPQARLLGGLVRDSGLAEVLDRAGRLPADARGLLIVEGGTDEAYLRLAAARLGREDVLDGVVIQPAGGAMAAALTAIVHRAESDVPSIALLDTDVAGRRARDTLVRRFGLDRGREVLCYADVLEGNPPDVEAETLFDPLLIRRFVATHGPSSHHRDDPPTTRAEVDLTSSGKSALVGWLDQHARGEHLHDWDALLDHIDTRLHGRSTRPAS